MPYANTAQDGPLWYLRRGSGIPLVAVHGAGGNSRHWGYQLAGLADVAQVIALDLPGHGRSPGSAPTTVQQAADLVIAFLDALALPKVIMMGHSLGGAVAQWLGRYAAGRVRGLVLIGSGAQLPLDATFQADLVHDPAGATERFARSLYRPGVRPATLEQAVAELQAVPPAVLANDYWAGASFDLRAEVPTIAADTLLIVGADDQLTPPTCSGWLQSQLPHAQLMVVPAAGHMVMVEQPAVVNAAIHSWLLDHAGPEFAK